MNSIDRQAEVVTEPARVWVIAKGDYGEQIPVLVVHGTLADAKRYADRYNSTHAWECEDDRAFVWCDAAYIAPPVQG